MNYAHSLEEIRKQMDEIEKSQNVVFSEDRYNFEKIDRKIIILFTFALSLGSLIEISRTFFSNKLEIFLFFMIMFLVLTIIFTLVFYKFLKTKRDLKEFYNKNQKYFKKLVEYEKSILMK